MIDYTLLENKNFDKYRAIYNKIPYSFRQKVKNTRFPLLIDLVKWVLIDKARPQFFHPYGLYFFCGLPGTGKTIYMSKMLADYRAKYGNSIYIATNYNFKLQDFAIDGYKDILKIYDKPIIVGYDEIQNDFDARAWADIDYAFSERITQSRKIDGMMILATAQKFTFVDKRLRQLTHLIYECKTHFNRLTVGKLYEPEMKEKIEGGQFTESVKLAKKGIRFFVQSDYIRNLYSSYDILKSISDRLDTKKQKPDKLIQDLRELLDSQQATADDL